MSTLSRTDFTQRFENRQMDLKRAESGLTSSQQRAIATADANGDGKISGGREINAAFTALDNFDRNGSRHSVNLGTSARPTALRSAVNALERASTAAPRRGLSGNADSTGGTSSSGTSRTETSPRSNTNVRNGAAHIDRTINPGARRQLVEGRVSVNGNTYDFRSGGHGRGSLPEGTYNITRHMDRRSDRSMTVGGEGYSFAMSDKFDSRVGGTRSLLRIHPDGASAGTEGCMGIVGDAATQRRFRADMIAELRRNGGNFSLTVN